MNSDGGMPNRRRCRAWWHTYNGGVFFVTVCTHNKQCCFGRIRDGIMELNALGKRVDECIQYVCKNKEIDIPLYVVMPNHFHAIVVIESEAQIESENKGALKDSRHQDERVWSNAERHHNALLSRTIGSLKSAVTKFAHQNGFTDFAWQERFHDHIIRKWEAPAIVEYIQTNPQRWPGDCFHPHPTRNGLRP